jgi:hypothetical protein
MLDEHMALRAAAERSVEVCGADGVDRNSARDSGRQLETLVGRFDVRVSGTRHQAVAWQAEIWCRQR